MWQKALQLNGVGGERERPLIIFYNGKFRDEYDLTNGNPMGASISDGRILLTNGSSSDNYLTRIVWEIDLTNYSELYIEASTDLVDVSARRVGYGTQLPTPTNKNFDGEYKNLSTTRSMYIFDISSVNGKRYVGSFGSNGSAQQYIYGIMLLP